MVTFIVFIVALVASLVLDIYLNGRCEYWLPLVVCMVFTMHFVDSPVTWATWIWAAIFTAVFTRNQYLYLVKG